MAGKPKALLSDLDILAHLLRGIFFITSAPLNLEGDLGSVCLCRVSFAPSPRPLPLDGFFLPGAKPIMRLIAPVSPRPPLVSLITLVIILSFLGAPLGCLGRVALGSLGLALGLIGFFRSSA